MHAYFAMQPQGRILALIPNDRFAMVLRGIAAAFGLGFGVVVIERAERGYRVECEEVAQTIELMLTD